MPPSQFKREVCSILALICVRWWCCGGVGGGSAGASSSGASPTRESMASYYGPGAVPAGHMERLRAIYAEDLKLFGYSWPGF